MKRLIAILLVILLLTGCTSMEKPEPTMAPIAPVADAEATVHHEDFDFISVSVPVSEEKTYFEDSTEIFSYIDQHIQMIHPDVELVDKIILDFLNRVDAVLPEAESVCQDAQLDYLPVEYWHPYFYHVIYSPTRIDHDVLSFTGMQKSYNGGIHGAMRVISANYDMLTGDVLTWGSIMHEDAKKEDFVSLILDKLEEFKDEYYLFDDYASTVKTRFDVDENFFEEFYFTNSGLCFYFSPYEIAPYASGIITVEIAYDELPGLLHDSYFPAEREIVQGSMHFTAFSEAETERFSNMAELTLTADESSILIYPEGTVEDIRITIRGDGKNIPDYTVFASPRMSTEDAIVLQASAKELHSLTIHYYSDGTNHQLSITE